MNKVSEKQARYNRIKGLIKKSLLNELHHCSCGSYNNLTLSHLVPVSQNKELEIDIKNCTIDCIKCHTIWEHGSWENREKLTDFYSRLKRIKRIDVSYFNRIFIKMPENIQTKFNKLWE